MSGIYELQYKKRINWKDAPSKETPLDSENLNHMDKGIQHIDAAFKDAVDQLVEMIRSMNNE